MFGTLDLSKIMLFHQSAAQAMKKRVFVKHLTVKMTRTYLYITSNKKILFVKKYFGGTKG